MSRGHIRPQGERSWQLKFDLGRDPITQKRITKYVSFKGNKREAQAELTRLLAQRDAGNYADPTKMTVAEYLQHWLAADVERRVGKRTAARYRQIVEKNIIPRLGHVPLRKLTAAHIEGFEADLHREGWVKARAKKKDDDGQPKVQEPRGLSNQTVLHVHRTLSQALNHAVRLEVLVKNPARQVKPTRPDDPDIQILDRKKSEVTTLLNTAKGTSLYAPVLVAITTGIRRGELLGLRWSDVDLKAATLIVNQAMQRTKGELEFKPPKTKKSRRTITLPAVTIEVLQAHRKEQLEQRMKLGLGRDPRDLVFTREDGQPLDPDSLSKAFERLIAKAEVTPLTLHGLRHTHISYLLMDGVHVKVVSERAGHANIKITLETYAKYLPNMQMEAAVKVNAWLR
jgi:integrase